MEQTPVRTGAFARFQPPPAVCGFLLLLGVVFTGAYAAGTAVGPVAPGIVGPASPGSGQGGTTPGHHSGGH
ncbi:hypothetical protein [Streptomyces sp. ODS05-4]|uniref:hypothetical protein n=1 Tax=Streptomyces sp. ODS05-4 TaxID=2944939 RepID=UPI00210A6053|nr:hypothetical protein [Streptomyces sp. ODS05-4]